MYKVLIILFITVLLRAEDTNTISFKPNYSYINVNMSYSDWSEKSENEAFKADYAYIGLEGGIGWNDVDFYGFLNIENPTHTYKEESCNNLRFSSFVDVDIEIKNNFKLHIQDFYLNGNSYYVNDFVVGIGYKLNTDFGLWFRPFVGVHHTHDTYYKGLNGYMGGWLFSYDFKIFSYKFNIYQWNEIEFERDKSFYLDENNQPIGDGESWGLNGAVSIWMYLNNSFAIGTQYRYVKNKQGSATYQSANIYTIKYSF